VKLLGLSPTPDAVYWVLYDRTFDRVFLAGVARLEAEDRRGRGLALDSWILQILDQYTRFPGINEVVVDENGDCPLPDMTGILRRRCHTWQIRYTEIPGQTVRARVTGKTDGLLVETLRPKYRAVLEVLDVAGALAAVLAWTPPRLSWFGRR
jgi:hypothetical protein